MQLSRVKPVDIVGQNISTTFSFCKTKTQCPLNNTFPSVPPLSPCQPPFCFLSLWIWLLSVPHISGIIQYLSFCDWHISVSILFLKVHACCNRWQDSLPFQGWIIFHCMVLAYILSIYIFVQAYILSIYLSSVDGYMAITSISCLLSIMPLWA